MSTANLLRVAASPLGFLSGLCGCATDERGGIVERIDGSFTNVMGLPTERLRATLEKPGVVHHA